MPKNKPSKESPLAFVPLEARAPTAKPIILDWQRLHGFSQNGGLAHVLPVTIPKSAKHYSLKQLFPSSALLPSSRALTNF